MRRTPASRTNLVVCSPGRDRTDARTRSNIGLESGRLTGRYVQGDCSGAEKVRRILQRYELTRYALVYAYGDSSEDREMLELAHKKFYRWKEISSWDDVTSYRHPSASRTDRGRESNAG
jgi:hypothetical protein